MAPKRVAAARLSPELLKAKKLEYRLAFYGGYHRDPTNKLIHAVFVPAIVWSVAVWAAIPGPALPDELWKPYVEKIPAIPGLEAYDLGRCLVPNLAMMLVLLYSNYYMNYLDFEAGVGWSLFFGAPTWLSATLFQILVPYAECYALALFVLSWYMQIYWGHHMYEKRRPALLASFSQAILTAPFFVWFELLFMLGYYKDTQLNVEVMIEEDIRVWKARVANEAAAAESALAAGPEVKKEQ
ncbi:hypothetical protein FOA52_013298 [Chlamydomonas sp. UWO 241]|nr:hypothetical protein FOA52_013298 [Chlamydomonas sp. UWO 241]